MIQLSFEFFFNIAFTLTLLCNVFVCSVSLPTSGCIIAFSFLNCSIFSFRSRRVATIFSTDETFCCNLPANMSAYLIDWENENKTKWNRRERNGWLFRINTFRNVSVGASVATVHRWLFPIPLLRRLIFLQYFLLCDHPFPLKIKMTPHSNSPMKPIRIDAFSKMLPTKDWTKKKNYYGKNAFNLV